MAEVATPFPDTIIPRGASAAQVQRILEQSRLSLAHHFGGGVYSKMVGFHAGDILVQHMHTHEHLSVLARGRVELLVNGERSVIDAEREPVVLTIAAGKHHGVKALSDGFWLCIHATSLTDPDAVDHTLVHERSSEPVMQRMVEALR